MNLVSKILLENEDIFQLRKIPEREVLEKQRKINFLSQFKDKLKEIWIVIAENTTVTENSKNYYLLRAKNEKEALLYINKKFVIPKYREFVKIYPLKDDKKI